MRSIKIEKIDLDYFSEKCRLPKPWNMVKKYAFVCPSKLIFL